MEIFNKDYKYKFMDTYSFNVKLNRYHKAGVVTYITSDNFKIEDMRGQESKVEAVFLTDLQMLVVNGLIYISTSLHVNSVIFNVDGVFYTSPKEVYEKVQDNTHFYTFVPEYSRVYPRVITRWYCVLCN